VGISLDDGALVCRVCGVNTGGIGLFTIRRQKEKWPLFLARGGVISHFDTDLAILFVGPCGSYLDGAYLYFDEARGRLSATESLWLGSGLGERLASGVFPGGTHRDLRDARHYWGSGRAHGRRDVFSRFSVAADGVCREVGAAVAQFFVWALSCMDAVDVPHADGGDVALDLCSAEAQLESRYRYSYLD